MYILFHVNATLHRDFICFVALTMEYLFTRYSNTRKIDEVYRIIYNKYFCFIILN